ncbi:MAG: hemolysin family protein [Planctomycetota bacterium]
MPLSILLMLLLLALLLVASGFFSGSETALFSLSRHQRARFAQSNALVPRTILTLLAETRGLLITLLLGNMTINVLYFVVSSVLLIKVSEMDRVGGVVLAGLTVVPLLAIILLGEVMPKLVASRLPDRFARVIALPMLAVHRVLSPIRVSSSVLVITPLSRLLAPPAPSPDLSPEELDAMLQLSRHHGVIDHGEQRVLEQVLELSQLKVRNLMVPRVDIQAFDLDQSADELMALIRRTRLRHIPACRGDLDNVVGLIYSRQAMLAQPKTAEDLEKLVRQVKFVPELQRADQTLISLRKTGTTFALAVDEYGGTAGLITLEDLVEHLVGNIPGAYEQSGEVEVEPLAPNRWRVDADLSVHEWADVFGKHQHFEAARVLASANTIGGLVMAELGRVPDVGDAITLGNVRLTVDRMDGHRIEAVVIELRDATAANADTQEDTDAANGGAA